MKKLKLLAIMIASAIPALMTAGTTEDPTIYRAVYYGTQASTNPNNPCKGATTRKCAEIESQLIEVSLNLFDIITTVTDASGNVISQSQTQATGTQEEIMYSIQAQWPGNAEMRMEAAYP